MPTRSQPVTTESNVIAVEAAPMAPKDPAMKPSVEPIGPPKTSETILTEPVKRHPHFDSLHDNDNYGFKSLFDSLNPQDKKGKHWYEKFTIRGYTQVRFGRTVGQDEVGADPFMTSDRSINGNAEDFSVRRARFIIAGDVSEYLYLYSQIDLANTLPSTTTTFFSQVRDLYGDVYLDKDKVNRFRVGVSKVPYSFDSLQSSQNRVPLDRSDAMNSGTNFNERDLGLFYYWTPKDKQKLLKDLVDGGLKGSGNYGIFAIGVYNGQGLQLLEANTNLHTVARVTYPFELPSGQVVEGSVQAYTGDYVVTGTAIRPRGVGTAVVPAGTGGTRGLLDQRIGGTFVWYPQPFGIQAEWNVGRGPALNDAQTRVEVRSLTGGYILASYKYDSNCTGIYTPYVRYQYYEGGYKNFANTPYGTHNEWNFGVEWQIRKEMELVVEYSLVNTPNLNALTAAGTPSYRNFDGSVLRAQFQINY
ncbi:MAG: OprO/OprP family phosphate-selective porin [Planctomycetes bacterium]|nr:OprO/OprP family phosphate-selective porin [Planctomycetota bacterium]